MATPRISRNTKRSSSLNDHQQVHVRIRALQQRTNALYEELSRSSSMTQTAMLDIEKTYQNIINEVQDQRDQLVKRLETVKKDIKQSTTELNHVRRNLSTAQSLRVAKNSSTTASNADLQDMNVTMDEIDRLLHHIAQRIKQYHFMPLRAHPVVRNIGAIRMKNIHLPKEMISSPVPTPRSSPSRPTNFISLQKFYSVDLDIHARWIVASIDKRLFLCDSEGEVRIYSYSRQLHRQPLLTERFHVTLKRLITVFTVTNDYLVTFELDTQTLALHSHHGALLVCLAFPFEPLSIVRGDVQKRNSVWVCSEQQRQCYEFELNHNTKKLNLIDQIDFSRPIENVYIDPVGISCDETNRVGIHDVAVRASDRLLLFADNQSRIVPLGTIKGNDERVLSSRLESIHLVPKQTHLIVVVYTIQYASSTITEIFLLNIKLPSVKILSRLFEPNGVENLDCTMNGEFAYISRGCSAKRQLPKMHVYRFTDEEN